jgi:ATP-dependent helicase IRC3
MNSAATLRPYQQDAIEAVAKAFHEDGQNRVLVKKPTGTGKTVMFAAMLKYLESRFEIMLPDYRGRKGARMLVIAHREELLDQARDKIQKQNPGLMVSIEQGDRHANSYSDVVIASIQTLSAMKFRRLKRLLERHSPRLVIVDEAHHAAAATYRTALAMLGFLPMGVSKEGDAEAATQDDVVEMQKALAGWDEVAPKDRLLVGVTATPNRSDAIGLGCVFQTIAYSYALKTAIDDGWLVPIKPWVVETNVSLDDVRISRGEFNQKDLAEAVNQQQRNQVAVAAWLDHAKGKSTIAFTVDVAHAHDLAAEFQRAGVQAVALSGETPREERRRILEDYTAGYIEVITNCMVLTEGTDLPRTECILHAKPTKSPTLYEQMTGRGLRIHPGKTECTVIDIVDVARRHSLQQAPVLYGLPPGIKTKGEDLRSIVDDLEALREKYPQMDLEALLREHRLTLEQLKSKASTFDIWSVPELGIYKDVVSMNWLRVSDDVFRLQYPWADGTEIIQVAPDVLGHFDVSCTIRPREGSSRQRTLAAQVANATDALRLAEAFVMQERRAVSKLKDREAPWRQRPASPKQLQLLGKWHVPHKPKGLTMGEASDLIDIAQARRFPGGSRR